MRFTWAEDGAEGRSANGTGAAHFRVQLLCAIGTSPWMAITEVTSASPGKLLCFPASPPKLAFFSPLSQRQTLLPGNTSLICKTSGQRGRFLQASHSKCRSRSSLLSVTACLGLVGLFHFIFSPPPSTTGLGQFLAVQNTQPGEFSLLELRQVMTFVPSPTSPVRTSAAAVKCKNLIFLHVFLCFPKTKVGVPQQTGTFHSHHVASTAWECRK